VDVKEGYTIKKCLHAIEVNLKKKKKLCISVHFCLMGHLPTNSVPTSAGECKGKEELHLIANY